MEEKKEALIENILIIEHFTCNNIFSDAVLDLLVQTQKMVGMNTVSVKCMVHG